MFSLFDQKFFIKTAETFMQFTNLAAFINSEENRKCTELLVFLSKGREYSPFQVKKGSTLKKGISVLLLCHLFCKILKYLHKES